MNILMLQVLPEDASFAGIDLIDVPGFLEFLVRFILNLGVILLLVRWLYFSTTKRKEYLFTYILISTVVFLLCFLLETVKLQLGFALGLFAIFGIIRYRTTSMPIREMTYLFLVIGISVINALTTTSTSFVDLMFANFVIVVITFALEKVWLLKNETSKTIIYEKIELIKPENYHLLLKDLSQRTGIKVIYRVETGDIDFLKDTCVLTIYYDSASSLTAEMIKQNGNDDEDDD